MKRIVLILLLFLAVIFQTAVFPNFSIWGIFPNIMLIIIASFCFSKNYLEASIWAVAGGLLLDINSAKSFGLTAISLMAAVIVIYFISESLDFVGIYAKTLLAIAASLVYFVAMIIFSLLFDLINLSDNLLYINMRMLFIIFFSTVINVVIIVLIYPFVDLFNKWLVKVERRLETKLL